MNSQKPRYSKEQFARCGNAIYERDILPKLSPKDVGKFLAIDIESGDEGCAKCLAQLTGGTSARSRS